MATTDSKEEVPISEKNPVEKDSVGKSTTSESRAELEERYDIVEVLQQANHITKTYANGITLGIRFNPISEARTVHADMVYVLDWRRAMFPRNSTAMKSAILDIIDRDTEDVFRDFGLQDRLAVMIRKTTKGAVSLRVLKQERGEKKSFLHETRSVYVVTRDTAPPVDLSWLTDPGRVVDADNFLLARKSDIRSVTPEIEKRIESQKWDILQSGLEFSWAGLLSALFTVISAGTTIYAYLTHVSSIWFSFIATILGLAACLGSIVLARKRVSEFNEIMTRERDDIARVGDDHRIQKTKLNNQNILDTLRTMRFVISPLMGRMIGALNVGDFEGAYLAAETVLDEVVRLSPYEEMEKKPDSGLNKFLTLFQYLDPEYDEASLSMVYVAFSDPKSDIVESEHILDHTSVLLEALYRSGIIPPESKAQMDEMLSNRGLKEFKGKLDATLADSDEPDLESLDAVHEETDRDDLDALESKVLVMMEKEEPLPRPMPADGEVYYEEGSSIPVIIAKTADVAGSEPDEDDSSKEEEEPPVDETAAHVVERMKEVNIDSKGGE
jgi:hypothetical protein